MVTEKIAKINWFYNKFIQYSDLAFKSHHPLSENVGTNSKGDPNKKLIDFNYHLINTPPNTLQF
ncbi:hypothetical protein BpHYR1_049850 [Brachionus plicatilis]|uniref:Uncharacterized protein n=1 Tax=Brachionus plicatilis TaxID=10195 RepID=A0A3M7SGF6_BRAPC|nr:hypothetical protein BpHYR1_049850 [Brachionus plicatilis]